MFRHENILEILKFILVLTVAAIPVAMPAVLSVTMAVGALNLAKKQAIVSRLVSMEELAGVDVLCSDKTGTITKNKISVAEVISYNNFKDEDIWLLVSEENSKVPRIEGEPVAPMLAGFHHLQYGVSGLGIFSGCGYEHSSYRCPVDIFNILL